MNCLMNFLILSSPKCVERVNANGNRVSTWRFHTFAHTAINPIASLFLDQNAAEKKPRKPVPTSLITQHLAPIGLAYW